MVGSIVFAGSGLGVKHWAGADGDVFRYTVPRDMTRGEVPWVGILVRGAMRVRIYPAAVDIKTFSRGGRFRPDDVPDLPAGKYEYVCEGETEYMCIGTINHLGRLTWEDFGWSYHEPAPGEAVNMPQGSILVVAEGEVSVKGEAKSAPQILHAARKDAEVVFNTRGRAILAWSL